MALSMWNPKEHFRQCAWTLWTKDMSVEEMRSFVVQTMMTLADTYERATSDKDHAKAIRGFTEELAKRIGVLGRVNESGEAWRLSPRRGSWSTR